MWMLLQRCSFGWLLNAIGLSGFNLEKLSQFFTAQLCGHSWYSEIYLGSWRYFIQKFNLFLQAPWQRSLNCKFQIGIYTSLQVCLQVQVWTPFCLKFITNCNLSILKVQVTTWNCNVTFFNKHMFVLNLQKTTFFLQVFKLSKAIDLASSSTPFSSSPSHPSHET